MAGAIRFNQNKTPRQVGELARVKIIQGPDVGALFVVLSERVTLGRGDGNDIVISDLKSSRMHAEFQISAGSWRVKDLGSANGIGLNGKMIREGAVRSGDVLTIGETTLEFLYSSELGTVVLTAPAKSILQVQQEQAALEAQKQRIKAMTTVGGVKSLGTPQAGVGSPSGEGGSRRLLLVSLGLVALYLLFMDNSPQPQPKKSGKSDSRNLAAFLPGTEPTDEIKQTSSVFFKMGFREFREKNYLRARTQFENVLQIDPNNRLAQIYLENAKQAIEDEVKFHLDRGRKTHLSGRLRESRGHYESVLRLLYRDQSHPGYTEAEGELKKVSEEIAKR